MTETGSICPAGLTSEGTDHDHPSTETLRGERRDADFGRNLADALAPVRRLAHQGYNGVGGMRDDGADDTGEVT